MPIKNYYTEVAAEKSVAEIQTILAKAGATRILTEYDGNGSVAALSFQVLIKGTPVSFILPADYAKMAAFLSHPKRRGITAIQPSRVRSITWRILKDWVAAQMALIQVGQVELPQVFLPYMQNAEGKSLYAIIQENPNRMLEAHHE